MSRPIDRVEAPTGLWTGSRNSCGIRAAGGIAAVLLLALSSSSLPAQGRAAVGAQRATRAELMALAATLERTAAEAGAARGVRRRAEADLIEVRNRLTDGDFHVGDRFVITLRRDSTQSDTIPVLDSLKVSVFSLPALSLHGVLRSELDSRMSEHVARFLRDVEIRTSPLARIAVMGAVRNPGYYYVALDRPVIDLVMLAGGALPEANLKQVEVSRSGKVLVKAGASGWIVKEGRAIEQVDLRSGDQVRFPQRRVIRWQYAFQAMFFLSSMFFAAIQFIQWYYNRKEM